MQFDVSTMLTTLAGLSIIAFAPMDWGILAAGTSRLNAVDDKVFVRGSRSFSNLRVFKLEPQADKGRMGIGIREARC